MTGAWNTSQQSFVPIIAALTARKLTHYIKMSEQTNSSPTSDQTTFLSNPNYSFIEIASLLAQEHKLSKFQHILASSSLRSIANSLARALEGLLVFKPQLEAMITHQGQTVFREDFTYYTETPEQGFRIEYNPFTMGLNIPGDIRCAEDSTFFLTKPFLESIWLSLDYAHFTNPLLLVMVSDLLNFSLNEDQLWAKQHRPAPTQFMQNYVELEKLIKLRIPEMGVAYLTHQQELQVHRNDVISQLAAQRANSGTIILPTDLENLYEIHGKHEEEQIRQDFWDLPEIREALIDLRMVMEKIVIALFPTVRGASERSSLPAFGYDVFFASVINECEVVVKTLGDYRVLHWEMNK